MKKQKLLVGKVKVTYIIAFMCLVRCVCPATPLPPTDGRSFYPLKPEDPHVIYFTSDKFQGAADGKTDVSEPLQQAIKPVNDAGAGTVYSALSNVNLKIEAGNPSAVGLRTHFAQHSFISHVDIGIGEGKAGIFDVGNEMEDVRFFGGDYGIYTTKPSPGWQFMRVDTYFEGQRKAAIRTQEAGLTIVRMNVREVPTVIDINENYHEKLFMEDCRLDKIGGPAIVISNERNAFNQVNLRNIDCRNTPVLIRYRRSGEEIRGKGTLYTVKSLADGLQMDDASADPVYKTTRDVSHHSLYSLVIP